LIVLSQNTKQTISPINGQIRNLWIDEKSDIYQYKFLSAITLQWPQQKVLCAGGLDAAGDLSSRIHRML
jgi:hypothetical protein